MREFNFFDPADSLSIVQRKLPHWSQAGVLSFITFRTHDSMPKSVVENFHQERRQWLTRLDIDPDLLDWRSRLAKLGKDVEQQFVDRFSDRWNDELDNCHGSCVLKDRSVAEIVATSLQHFDGERYELTDFVVMPTHVHVLAAFSDEDQLLKQCESWKHFTATNINRLLGLRGRFWQQDGFDHLVRSLPQFEYLRSYIANNPCKAKLKTGEFWHYSKDLTADRG